MFEIIFHFPDDSGLPHEIAIVLAVNAHYLQVSGGYARELQTNDGCLGMLANKYRDVKGFLSTYYEVCQMHGSVGYKYWADVEWGGRRLETTFIQKKMTDLTELEGNILSHVSCISEAIKELAQTSEPVRSLASMRANHLTR